MQRLCRGSVWVVRGALPLALAGLALVACTGRAPLPASNMAPQPAASAAILGTLPIDVAITVDDLPDHGPEAPGQSRLAIHEAFLAAFRAHHVPPVYGFVVGAALDEHPDDRAALEAWLAAGNLLGSHTRTHPDIHKTSVDAYLADVDANEALLKSLSRDDRAWHVFRYPYLEEGNDLPTRAHIREHLAQRGYRVAQVTIDFYDWAYNEPYARCFAKKDMRAIDALKQSYLDDAIVSLRWSDEAARALVGRPIAQILLLHIGAFDALLIDELLTRYRRAGARFVSLDQAMADPIYAEEPKVPKAWEGTFLEQVRQARDVTSPVEPALPEGLLDALCR
jgi:peptidoglycan-N-acetylglucosamine deacetylase